METLKPMKVAPVQIKLKDPNKVPIKYSISRRYPKNMEAVASNIEKSLEGMEIIRRVNHPTKYCCPSFFVPKSKPGDLRLVTDFTPLNDNVDRAVHPTGDVEAVLSDITPEARFILLLDCKHGYYQLPIAEESQELTTFLLPSGTWCYRRLPQGLRISSDEWCRHSQAVLRDIPDHTQLVDDICMWSADFLTLARNFRRLLQKCKDNGITLNPKKVQVLAQPGDSAIFCGHSINIVKDGVEIRPDPGKLDAIKNFPQPKNATDVKSFMGLCCQLGQFHPHIQQLINTMRGLVKKDVAFVWTPEIDKEFKTARQILSSDAVVRPFDLNAKTELITDASRLGFGYVLLQRPLSNPKVTNLITCGSTSLSSAQKNYSTLELELNAIVWAMRKSHRYLYWAQDPFKVITDHQPLKAILTKALNELPNARVQRLCERIVDYNFVVEWTKGIDNHIADALSRAPVNDGDIEFADEAIQYPGMVACVLSTFVKDNKAIPNLDTFAESDTDYKKCIEAWQNQHEKPLCSLPTDHPARQLTSIWNTMSLEGNLLINDDRIVVPQSAVKFLTHTLHDLCHMGGDITIQNARELYWWPGMKQQLRNVCDKCPECAAMKPSHRAETLQQIKADYPMMVVSSDIFTNSGNKHVTFFDKYSGYLLVSKPLKNDSSSTIIKQFDAWAMILGYCRFLISDGGPCYKSEEFADWCKANNITHHTSDPHFPSANIAESGVKIATHMMSKHKGHCASFERGLLEYNNSPKAYPGNIRVSPAQLYFGRRLHTKLPALPSAYQPIDMEAAKAAKDEHDLKVKKTFDKSAKDLLPLQVGDLVYIQHSKSKRWTIEGVISAVVNNRSYKILSNGSIYRRNRRHLRLRQEVTPSDAESADEANSSESSTPRRSARLQAKNADKNAA